MAGLRVIWVGRSQHRFVDEGIDYYHQRIQPFQSFELVEVKAADHSGRDPNAALRKESDAILKRVSPGETVILLDERGRHLDTRQFADWLSEQQDRAGGALTFIVGGAYGVDERVRKRAQHTIALSRLTFPHQLVRVILLEQLYRALSLLAGHGYHHD